MNMTQEIDRSGSTTAHRPKLETVEQLSGARSSASGLPYGIARSRSQAVVRARPQRVDPSPLEKENTELACAAHMLQLEGMAKSEVQVLLDSHDHEGCQRQPKLQLPFAKLAVLQQPSSPTRRGAVTQSSHLPDYPDIGT